MIKKKLRQNNPLFHLYKWLFSNLITALSYSLNAKPFLHKMSAETSKFICLKNTF